MNQEELAGGWVRVRAIYPISSAGKKKIDTTPPAAPPRAAGTGGPGRVDGTARWGILKRGRAGVRAPEGRGVRGHSISGAEDFFWKWRKFVRRRMALFA
jgi:hypothetical protein